MKRSLGTELCCLLGPDGGTGVFLGGEESGPLLRQSGQHRFPSCSYDAIQKQHKKKKKKKQYFADSCHHWKKNGAVGIKGPRLYTAAEAESGWKWRIAWFSDWLEGKDSMIDWLRVPWIMGHSYLGLDRWTSFGWAEAI